MNNLNLNLFKYFYYVTYYHGFTNASKELNVAQSALSYNVKTLEELINKKLIIRNSKKFELTEDGYNLYESLKSVFTILEDSINNISDKHSNYLELTIGVRHFLSDFIFRNSIKKFTRLHPNIHLNIVLYSKLDVEKFEKEYDIVIDYLDYTSLIENGKKELLCSLENIIVCGKKLFNIYSNVSSIRELSETKFILPCPSRKNGKIQKLCFENGILLNNLISLNDSNLYKKLVEDNVALSIIPREYVKEELEQNKVYKINIKDKLFTDKIEIVHKPERKIEIIEKFLKVLLNEYNGGEQ